MTNKIPEVAVFSPPGLTTIRSGPVAIEPVDVGAVDWNLVHDEVQGVLAGLSQQLRKNQPGLRISEGRSHGGSFYLFSFVTYSRVESPDGPTLVVGCQFDKLDGKVRIVADMSMEESGEIHYQAKGCLVRLRSDEIVAAARDLANELAVRQEIVVKALAG